MTITTRDQLINALANNNSQIVIGKASLANTVAGQIFSLWTATGSPAAGAAPGAPAIPSSATTGAMVFQNQTPPATSYLGWLALSGGVSATSVEIHDRLAHMAGLSGIVTTAQSVGLEASFAGAPRYGSNDFSSIKWWIEIYTPLGATSVNATANVEYNDLSTGNLAVTTLGVTPRSGRLYPLVSAVAGKYIKAVNSVTLSATTGTAGNFGITATRLMTNISLPLANKSETFDWAQLGLPNVANDSCLQLILTCGGTTTGTVMGNAKIIHG